MEQPPSESPRPRIDHSAAYAPTKEEREEQEKLRQDLIARYGFDVLAAERKKFGKSITAMIDLAKQDHERRRKQEQERQQES